MKKRIRSSKVKQTIYDLVPLPESIILDEAECRCVAMAFLLDGEVDVWLEQCKEGMKCSTGLRWYQQLSSRFTKKHFMLV